MRVWSKDPIVGIPTEKDRLWVYTLKYQKFNAAYFCLFFDSVRIIEAIILSAQINSALYAEQSDYAQYALMSLKVGLFGYVCIIRFILTAYFLIQVPKHHDTIIALQQRLGEALRGIRLEISANYEQIIREERAEATVVRIPQISYQEYINACKAKLQIVDENEFCSICIEKFTVGNVVVNLPCSLKHVFHGECIKTWLFMNDKCPLCKALVTALIE